MSRILISEKPTVGFVEGDLVKKGDEIGIIYHNITGNNLHSVILVNMLNEPYDNNKQRFASWFRDDITKFHGTITITSE